MDASTPPDFGVTGDLLPPPVGPAGRADINPIVDDVERYYIRSVPESAVAAMAAGPVPLLIVLHGAGDTAENFMAALRFEKLASDHAFVLAVPDGYNRGWFVQGNEGWAGEDGEENSLQNDVHLFQEIIRAAAEEYWIDVRRIYVCGHSRGGGMTGLLATISSNPKLLSGKYQSPFAAYAINAGFNALGDNSPYDFSMSGPKRPIWIIHGDMDRTVVYQSGANFSSDLEAAGWPVTLTTVPGAGHTWLFQSRYGQTNDDLWKFFADNPLP